MIVSLQSIGDRYYLRGNFSAAIEQQLDEIGCEWDADRERWFTTDRDTAIKLVSSLVTESKQEEAEEAHREELAQKRLYGKVEYKGRTWYVVGIDKERNKFHLTTFSRKIDFWVAQDRCEWREKYAPRLSRRGDTQYRTIDGIRRYLARREAEGRWAAQKQHA